MSLTPEQLAIRRKGITATDVPAILGLSPWRSPFDVWAEKLGKAPPVEETEDMERGNFLEDGARRWYAHRTGYHVMEIGTVVKPDEPLVIATPDGIAHRPDGRPPMVLEIKMPSGAHGWGEPGTDAIPQHYLVQVAWQMAAVMLPWTDVFAVLEGKPRLYHVARDVELEGLLIQDMEQWWRDYVVTGKPPPVTHRDLESVEYVHRRHEGDSLLDFSALPTDAQVALEEYLRAYAEESAASERRSLWETRAKLALGAAPGVRGLPEALGFHRLDWRAQAGKTAWKKVAEALAKRLNLTPTQLSALAAENTGEGSRPFIPRPTRKGGR